MKKANKKTTVLKATFVLSLPLMLVISSLIVIADGTNKDHQNCISGQTESTSSASNGNVTLLGYTFPLNIDTCNCGGQAWLLTAPYNQSGDIICTLKGLEDISVPLQYIYQRALVRGHWVDCGECMEFEVESISPLICGDANGDGIIDISDAVTLIRYIFNSEDPWPGFPPCICDANGDGSVDISDVVYLVQFIFAGGPAPHENCCQ